MSSAFLKEGDDMWLNEIPPTIEALKNYLTRENSGIKITEKESFFNEIVKAQVHKMSDGCSYFIKDNRWVSIN